MSKVRCLKACSAILVAVAMLAVGVGSVSAAQGPWALPVVNLSEPDDDSFDPQVATGPDGTTTAVWRRFVGPNLTVQAATRPPGGNFGAPVNLSEPGQHAVRPQISTGPDGTTTVIWMRLDGSKWRIQAVSRPPGGTFGAAVNLSEAGQNADYPEIVTGPDGTAAAVWQRFDGSNMIVQAASRPPHGTFGQAASLSEPGQDGVEPQVTVSADGAVTVLWNRFNGSNSIIQAATKPSGGSFGPVANVSASGRSAYQPRVTSGPDGTVTAAWQRFDGTHWIIQSSTRPPGGSFGSATNLSQPGQHAYDPQIETAPDGTTTAAWRWSNGVNRIVQAASRPPGGSFGPTATLSAPGQDALDPQLSVGPGGTANLTWRRYDGSSYVVQAATKPPGESFGPVVNLSEPGQHAYAPQISTGTDIATVVWHRSNGTKTVIQAASTEWVHFGFSVTTQGTGSGAIKSVPSGIDCGSVCSNEFLSGAKVTLTAAPAQGSTFDGWGGACASAGQELTCQVTMDQAKEAFGTFTKVSVVLPQPTDSTAVFDGKYLYVRLKCAARFKPGCRGFAQAVTKKRNGKPMSSKVSAAQKAGKWKVLKLAIKPSFRAKVMAMGKQPTKKLLVVKSVVAAKKYKRGKKFTVFHTYRVRTAG